MALQKMGDFSFKHSEQQDDLYRVKTAEEVKEAFDSRGEELKAAINKLIDQLQSVEIGNSGARNIKATPISGVNGEDVQTILEGLKGQISTTVIGQIPDGTLTKELLAFDAVEQRELDEEINEHNKVYASTTTRGHVQLSNATDSDSETFAATSKAVKDLSTSIASTISTMPKLVLGSYMGSGGSTARVIDIGFTPKYFRIVGRFGSGEYISVENAVDGFLDKSFRATGYAVMGEVTNDVRRTTNGIIVNATNNNSHSIMNVNGQPYNYVALG